MPDTSKPNPITVSVSLTLTVDPEAWALTYNVEGAAAIREDVRSYVLDMVQNCAAADEKCITAADRKA